VGEQNPHNCPRQRLNITMSKSAVRYFVRKVSTIKIAKGPRYRIRVKKPCVDVDSRELLALEASYGRSSLKTLSFLIKALEDVY
jgi:hypothetical protein